MLRPSSFRPKLTPDLAAAIAISCLSVIYFLPAILRGIVLCPDGDGLLFNVPLRVAAARIALSGSLPLWNPYIFSGMPLHAAAQGGLLFPLNWFYLAFSAPTATNLMTVLTYSVAALGAYLYARQSGASIAGAIVTSIVWQWGGFLIAQISHINMAQTAAMLPWVLWAVDGYGLSGERKWGVAIAFTVALQTFVGHQQTLAYSLLLVAAYASVSALAQRPARSRYFWSLAFVAAGLLLAAAQIVPTFELLRNSLRTTATYEFSTSFSMPPRFVLTFFAPYVLGGGDGRLFRAPYIGPPFYTEFVGYVGLLTIMLALTALLLRRDARTNFWAVAAVVCLLLAFGGYAPLRIYEFVYRVPVLNLFRVPARHLMIVEFALAVLAGRGLTALAGARGSVRAWRRAAIAGTVVFLLTWSAVTWLRPAEFHLGRKAPVSILRAPELFLPILIAGVSAWALWVFARGRRPGAGLLLLAVLALDLAVWGQSSGWRTTSLSRDSEYWNEPEAVRALSRIEAQDRTPYRILTAPHPFDPAIPPVPPLVSHATDWYPWWAQPDIYMMHGIQNAAGYDGFGLARYSRLAGGMTVWGELINPELTLRGPSREIDLLNVRYLLSLRPKADVAAETSPAFPPATKKLGDFMVAEGDLGEPNFGAGRQLTFSVPPVEADRIALQTNLSWSANVPDGAIVGRVRLHTRDGVAFEFPLRAGRDTSEWAYDSPVTHARHSRAAVATSYRVEAPEGNYEGHTYVTSFAFPERVTVTGGKVVAESSANWPNLQLGVFRVSLIDSGQGKAYPLRREWANIGDAVESEQKEKDREDRWRLLAETRYIDIYENRHALPRAWLASEARALGEQATLEVIRTGKLPDGSVWEPQRTALVESEPPAAFAAGTDGGRAEVTGYEANRVEVKTVSGAPAILVVGENHYPGWRAYLDGKRVGVLRVDYGLRGVIVPAGEHNVRFVYRPESALIGLLVSIATAAALALWCARLLPEKRVASQNQSATWGE